MRNRIQTIEVSGKRQVVKQWRSFVGAKGVAVLTASQTPTHAHRYANKYINA